jgi:hypothetical protein
MQSMQALQIATGIGVAFGGDGAAAKLMEEING